MMEGRMMEMSVQTTPNLVRAVFKDAALSFNLPRHATLEQLAQKLASLGRRYGGLPLYVDVRLRS
jgi:hypothetical protein